MKINKIFNFSNDIFAEEKYIFVFDEEEEETFKFPKFINQWKLIKNIGIGGWGYVFECKDKTKNRYAIKVELKEMGGIPDEVMKVYSNSEKIKYIPKMYDVGICGKYNYIVLEKLKELETDDYNGNTFSKAITALENFHLNNISHNDVKIGNIMKNNKGDILLIDFGMTRKFGFKRPPNSDEWCYGTPKYMGLDAHNKIISRRNDLESLLYVILSVIGKDEDEDIWNSEKFENSTFDEKLKEYKIRKKYLRELCYNKQIEKIKKELPFFSENVCRFFMLYMKHLQKEKNISYDYLRKLVLDSEIYPQ